MGFLSWLCGFNAEAQKQSDRLTDGVRRIADITHAAADRMEEALGMKVTPQVIAKETLPPEKKRRA